MYHCFFEQSGTFKNAFKKLGGVAKDYDILNEYGETDKVIDLYDEIEKAYLELSSIFDNIKPEDYIIAFFPCTEFEDQKNMMMLGNGHQQAEWSDYKKLNYNLYKHKELSRNYELITKLVLVCIKRNIKLIIENPKGTCHYLTRNWGIKAKVIDNDRRENGDYYKKPTQYWFVGCEPKFNLVFEMLDYVENRGAIVNINGKIDGKDRQTLRSEIHPQYAERFIKQYIADNEDGVWKV